MVQSVWDNLPEETYAAKIDKCVNALVDMGPLDEVRVCPLPMPCLISLDLEV